MNYWRSVYGDDSYHYNIFTISCDDSMAALKTLFPDGVADEMNAVLFSTSGVHGTYNTIEEAEEFLNGKSEEGHAEITFLVIHPRTVTVRYGVVQVETMDDIEFLKKLRQTSRDILARIG